MDETDRSTLLKLMTDGTQALGAAVGGVSDAQASARPDSGGWTIAEVLEHVATSEEQMFTVLTQRFREALQAAPDPAREKLILETTLDRARKMTAPEVSRPSGRFATLTAALEHFRACRARSTQYVRETHDDLRHRTVKHPLAGVVSAYEYVLILANHPARHAAQIRELRAAAATK